MSRASFKARLARLGKPPAAAPDQAPKPRPRRQLVTDRSDDDAPLWHDLALLGILMAMGVWLMVDFWRALPVVTVIALALGLYSVLRSGWGTVSGRDRHRRQRSQLWGLFEGFW